MESKNNFNTNYISNLTVSDQLFKKKLVGSLAVLSFRRVMMQVIITLSNVILARILVPEIFGAFAIISFLTVTFGTLVNFGLGPAIVQKKAEITAQELRAVFTLLLVATLLFILFVILGAPLVDRLYQGKLGMSGIFWLRLFSFSVLFDHLAVIPLRLLDRKLEFTKITFGETIQIFIIQIVTIILALRGFGVGAFVIGNLVGKFLAIALFFKLSPWKIGINFRFSDLKNLLPFGLNFQTSNIINSINSSVVPGLVGLLSGPQAVGFITWAGGIRQAGLAPVEVIDKLIFPAASRIQDKPLILKSLIERLIRLSALLSFPLLAIIFALAPNLILIIYTDKWLPGLTVLYLSLIQGIFLLLGIIFIDVLLALGESATVRNITLFWAGLQWLLSVPLVLRFGFSGAVIAGILVSMTFFIPLSYVRKFVSITVLPFILPYLIYSIVTCIFVYIIDQVVVITSIWQLIPVGIAGLSFYLLMIIMFEKKTVLQDISILKKLFGNLQ